MTGGGDTGKVEPTQAGLQREAQTFASGRYIVLRLLGEGGQKIVYLVQDTALDRECALALVKTDLLAPEELARVRREARVIARLGAQPNIVTVFDIGEHEGRPYIVCEYVAGGDLRRELVQAGAPLSVERAVAIAQDLCRGLAVAHRQGVIHRDVKPANVWLTEDRTAKLGDFGLALALDRSSRLTMVGTITGTATYMAPEQALGAEIDARTDLYSVGCVLYEMVCGRPPFAGDDPLAVISQHIHTQPTPPAHLNPEVPPSLEQLIQKLLSKDKDERPSSAQELLVPLAAMTAALTASGAVAAEKDRPAAVAGRPPLAQGVGPPHRPVRPTGTIGGDRHDRWPIWRVALGAGLALAALGVGLGASFSLLGGGGGEPSHVQQGPGAVLSQTGTPETSTHVPLSTPTSAAKSPALPTSGTAVDVVRLFYELLQQREYARAYVLLSSNYQQGHPYSSWVVGYNTTESIKIEFIQPDTAPNLVSVSVVAVDPSSNGPVTRRFAGQWQLVLESGKWRLDVGRINQVPT